MKNLMQMLALICAVTVSSGASADDAAVKKAVGVLLPQAKVDSIKPSEIKGLQELRVGANIFYVSDDGRYLIQGQLFDAEAKKNLTEGKLAEVRKAELDKVGVEKMIIYKADNSKHTVSIFTDIDCGYCRKLHSEIDQYLAQGITVRYLFFPRAGKGSDSYKKAVSVWCAPDRNKALTAAKKSEAIEPKTCANPVDEHMDLGEAFGMSGTPMIITEKGNLLPGYVPAQQLSGILNNE